MNEETFLNNNDNQKKKIEVEKSNLKNVFQCI